MVLRAILSSLQPTDNDVLMLARLKMTGRCSAFKIISYIRTAKHNHEYFGQYIILVVARSFPGKRHGAA